MSLHILNLSKSYGDKKALDQVSFTINKGEIVGFLGPNGAGKSTLMKIITGYITSTQGHAKISGYDIEAQKRNVQKHIGYLPEHNPLYLDMYVREYLDFQASIFKIESSRIETVIAETGLTQEVNKKIEHLSKGYRQRVGLACALLHQPEVLILDEPTTGLDPNQLVEIRSLITRVGKDKTVFLSTHIMQEVEAICDRVIIINKGKIVADKNLNELREHQKQIIEVEFDYRVETLALEKLPHIEHVKNTIGFLYELEFNTKEDMRPVLFDFAKHNGLKTLQLNQKNKTLEDLFIELTKA